MTTPPTSVDVLVVGSGPAGSAFAREITEAVPGATVLMVEIGPRLTEVAGRVVRNLPPAERVAAQKAAEEAPGYGDGRSSDMGVIDGRLVARPGTVLVDPGASLRDDQIDMPAAALASDVGGMAAHWTCACPKPGDSERIPFLGAEFDAAFERASELLHVTTEAFPGDGTSAKLMAELSTMFDEGRDPDRRVQRMPLACTPMPDGRVEWSGTDTILGPLASEEKPSTFILADETLCRRLIHTDGVITGAELVHLPTGDVTTVSLRVAVVAADALRTPQLLWASGIRPAALGRYLNDQPQLHSVVTLHDDLTAKTPDEGEGLEQSVDPRELLVGVLWVPFRDPDFPYHTQIMQSGTAPIAFEGFPAGKAVVGYGRFLAKDIRAEDRVEFGEELDRLGMPAIRVRYGLSETDRANIDLALKQLHTEAERLGSFIPGEEPRLVPAGSSMHYQGTVRMGEADDGTSVCDSSSRVWGTTNLYVGGNGVIPTATACNPTVTAVALCVLASRAVAEQLTDPDRA